MQSSGVERRLGAALRLTDRYSCLQEVTRECVGRHGRKRSRESVHVVHEMWELRLHRTDVEEVREAEAMDENCREEPSRYLSGDDRDAEKV